MIVLAGFLLGAALGALAARRRGGNRLDMIHYGGVWGLIGALLGLVVTIAITRMMAG